MSTKKQPESPLSHYIRVFCSTCKNWETRCDPVTDSGQFRMLLCILASMSASLNSIRKSYAETGNDYWISVDKPSIRKSYGETGT